MITISVSEFRRNQKKYFDISLDQRVIIHRGKAPAIVLCPLAALDETDFLLSSPANTKHILKGVEQLNAGDAKRIELDDLWK